MQAMHQDFIHLLQSALMVKPEAVLANNLPDTLKTSKLGRGSDEFIMKD